MRSYERRRKEKRMQNQNAQSTSKAHLPGSKKQTSYSQSGQSAAQRRQAAAQMANGNKMMSQHMVANAQHPRQASFGANGQKTQS